MKNLTVILINLSSAKIKLTITEINAKKIVNKENNNLPNPQLCLEQNVVFTYTKTMRLIKRKMQF